MFLPTAAKTAYVNNYQKWLSGLLSEINFWRSYMATRGLQWASGFEEAVSLAKKFPLEEFISDNRTGGGYRCIDIGCGPFPIGHTTDKVKLNFQALDPLGHVYNNLKRHYKLNDGVTIKTGHVELLNELYAENTFDLVHMSNSLDHCFDPLHGLQELLFICKVGGKVILRHAENEAVNQKYSGLHQWNLSLLNEEHSFVIWRGNERYDVCELLSSYADFELRPMESTENGGHNTVIIKKTNQIDVPSDANYYSEIIHDCNYKFLLDVLTAIRAG